MGYADGLRLYLEDRREGLRGRKLPIVGNITMDQFLVDCGDTEILSGDAVVLLVHNWVKKLRQLNGGMFRHNTL